LANNFIGYFLIGARVWEKGVKGTPTAKLKVVQIAGFLLSAACGYVG